MSHKIPVSSPSASVASRAWSTVKSAATAFNNIGVGNDKDPVAGHLGHHRVRRYSGSADCQFGFKYDAATEKTISCIASSPLKAPDGCPFEGRFAVCFTSGSTDLNNCPSGYQEWFSLRPACPPQVAPAPSNTTQSNTGIAMTVSGYITASCFTAAVLKAYAPVFASAYQSIKVKLGYAQPNQHTGDTPPPSRANDDIV